MFDRVVATNLRGVFLGMKYQIRQFLRQAPRPGGYSIVNIGSAATRKATPSVGPYVATKLAVEGLTKVAAVEYSGRGIRFNTLMFGVFDTELSRAFYAVHPELRQAYLDKHDAGRFGDPDKDAGAAACYLMSEQSAFMTGATIPLDGGLSL